MSPDNATLDARKIIDVVRAQVQIKVTPMYDVAIVPNVVRLTLHPDDYHSWLGRKQLLQQQLEKSLRDWVAQVNQRPFWKIGRSESLPYSLLPDADWSVELVADPNDEVHEGQVAVAVSAEPVRIRAVVSVGLQGPATEVLGVFEENPTQPIGLQQQETVPLPATKSESSRPAVRVRWSDGENEHTKVISKAIFNVGRGGGVEWIDVKLTHPTISRVHMKVRQSENGDVEIFNCSENGVVADGTDVPKEQWWSVPTGARLGLPSGAWLFLEPAEVKP